MLEFRLPRRKVGVPTEASGEKFEGPLDLLLQLIEQEEMNISEVSLSKITEQFFVYLDKLEQGRSEELADFLVIGAKLVYLKSRQLLPVLHPEEDDGPSLADQLKMYKQYVEASKKINELWEAGKVSYGRMEPPVKAQGFTLPANGWQDDLYHAMHELVKRLKPIDPLPAATIDYNVSVKQKIDSLRSLLKKGNGVNFVRLLSDAKNKTEVIVSFLAVLELVKEKWASVKQKNAFGEMVVEKV
ncbi:hypothetical protein EPN28_03870 [Patescibacteria group bacterium]|nr:MAG: hypothetical protein EPN28_03870 [Patescibacteria group bacterium]